MQRLDPHYRQVLELRYLKDLKTDDVAKKMGKTPDSVNMIAHRAKKKVRESLKEWGS